MANRAIRYRLRPNEEQRILIGKTFGCCRKVWDLNAAVNIRNEGLRILRESLQPA